MMRIIAIHQQQQAILIRQVGKVRHGHHAIPTLGDDLKLRGKASVTPPSC